MGTRIHMETEAVEAVARQIQKAAQEMEMAITQLRHEQYRLNGGWMGVSAGMFAGDLQHVLQRLSTEQMQLHNLGTRLSAEVQEWLEADQHFGPGMASTASTTSASHASAASPTVQQIQDRICGRDDQTCREKWKRPPQDAEALAYQVMSLPKDTPYVIMDLGNGEYLVMLRGTTDNLFGPSGWFSDGTDWDQNAPAFLGIPGLYQNAVVATILASVPSGAKLHFAGHSQGGMVAQNMAVDPRLKDYQIESVTMFGSPTTLAQMNPDAKYVSYEAQGDIVPKLDDVIWGGVKKAGGKIGEMEGETLGGPVGAAIGHVVGEKVAGQPLEYIHQKEALMERGTISEPSEARSLNPWVSHNVYNNEGVLRGKPMGFNTPKTWGGQSVVGRRIPGVAERSSVTVAGIGFSGKSGSGSW